MQKAQRAGECARVANSKVQTAESLEGKGTRLPCGLWQGIRKIGGTYGIKEMERACHILKIGQGCAVTSRDSACES